MSRVCRHHFSWHIESLFVQDHVLLCISERTHRSERSCRHIVPNLVIMEAYILLAVQNVLNNTLGLHFRAQQSVSEAPGVHVWCCNAVAFQHEHKIRGTEESPVTSVCQKTQIALLYLPTPCHISALMTVAYCHRKICTLLYNHFSEFFGQNPLLLGWQSHRF